jgi:RHS repeat-associated protein
VPDSETTIFVYDAGGKLIGEYSTVVQPVQDAKTVYTTNDHLGSPRINTDGVGAAISRHDYHPFGEEIARTGYGSDTIRKQFTGYERDSETDLDFAQARMYSITLGRFTSSDPLMASATIITPQSWNRYSYVLNNPLNLVDPSGEKFEDLTKEQLRVFQTYVDQQNKGRETSLSAAEVYKGLSKSQQTTFSAVTHALENSTVTDKDGKSVSALSFVEGVTQITGAFGDDPNAGVGGSEQFRLLVSLKQGATEALEKSKEFDEKDITSGHIFKDGKVTSVDGNLRQNANGFSARLQISFNGTNPLVADIDVDYRKQLGLFNLSDKEGHLKPYNSDVRAVGPETSGGKPINNLERHNARYGKTNPLRNIPIVKP